MKRRDNKRKGKKAVCPRVEDDDKGSRLWFGLVLIKHRFEFDSIERANVTVKFRTTEIVLTQRIYTRLIQSTLKLSEQG